MVDVERQRDVVWWASHWHVSCLHVCVVARSRSWAKFAFSMWGAASTLSWSLMNSLQLALTLCLQLRYECDSGPCWLHKIYRVFLSVGLVLPLQSGAENVKRNDSHGSVCFVVKQIQQKAKWNILCNLQLERRSLGLWNEQIAPKCGNS